MNEDNYNEKIVKYYKNKARENYKCKYDKLDKMQNISAYYNNKARIQKQINIYSDLIKDDIIYKIVNNLSKRADGFFKSKNIKRDCTYIDLIGCDYLELKNHIQNLFRDNMSFENYGQWELDHIIPVSSLNSENIDEIKKIFNYKNIPTIVEN